MSYLQALNAGALTQSSGPAVTNAVSIMQRTAPSQICPNGIMVYDWAGPYTANYPDTTGLTYDIPTKRFTNSNAYNVLVLASYTVGFDCSVSTVGYRASSINVSGATGQDFGYNMWVPAPLDFEEQLVNASTSFVLAPGAYFTTVVLQNSGGPIPMSFDAFASFVVVKI
jgi:hypothetical protein